MGTTAAQLHLRNQACARTFTHHTGRSISKQGTFIGRASWRLTWRVRATWTYNTALPPWPSTPSYLLTSCVQFSSGRAISWPCTAFNHGLNRACVCCVRLHLPHSPHGHGAELGVWLPGGGWQVSINVSKRDR